MTEASRDHADLAGWPAAAVVTGLLLTLLVPGAVLALLHVNYDTPSGAAWEKVHPGSDLLLLGCAGAVCREGRPGARLADWARRFPGSVAFLMITGFLAFYLITVLRAPFTPLIDTFVVPVAALVAVVELSPAWKARLEAAIHLFVAGNGLLGIGEFLSGWRLVPAAVAGVEQTAAIESRAFGLLGHPLASAGMAGLYATVLMCGGGRRLPARLRGPALALQFLALGAFGGRTALVMTAVCAVAAAGVGLLRVLAGRPVDLRHVALGLLLAPGLLAAAAAVGTSGFFDNVLNRFTDDNGSAAARHAIFDLFGYLSWPDLLYGPDQDHLASVQHLVGIEVGVESFWLGFILAYGLLPSLVFFAGYGLFLADTMRRCTAAAWGPLLFFTGTVSTAISLSAKTTMLAQFVAMLVILMPRATVARSARRPAAALVPALP